MGAKMIYIIMQGTLQNTPVQVKHLSLHEDISFGATNFLIIDKNSI